VVLHLANAEIQDLIGELEIFLSRDFQAYKTLQLSNTGKWAHYHAILRVSGGMLLSQENFEH